MSVCLSGGPIVRPFVCCSARLFVGFYLFRMFVRLLAVSDGLFIRAFFTLSLLLLLLFLVLSVFALCLSACLPACFVLTSVCLPACLPVCVYKKHVGHDGLNIT